MLWKELPYNYCFVDDSTVTQKHEIHNANCYSFKGKDDKELVISSDHYLLCDVSKIKKDYLKKTLKKWPKKIPLEMDLHIAKKGDDLSSREELVKEESIFVNKKLVWLSAQTIYFLLTTKQKLFYVHDLEYNGEIIKKYKKDKFRSWNWVGERECYCISTNTGKYECCGFTHHNSVTLRNIIFHALTHSDDIKLALVDLKLSEFSRYKEMNNVVGVANTVRETAELLRLARQIMYKRNKQNADRDLTDFVDYKPTQETNIIRIFGREFDENTKFPVKLGEEDKQMTAKEILDYITEE